MRAHGAALVARLVDAQDGGDVGRRILAEVVPLVAAGPALRKRAGGGMLGRSHDQGGVLDARMALEVGADQAAVPGPVVLGVAGRMDAGEAAAAADEALQRGLLLRVQRIAAGVEEHDCLVACKRRIVELIGRLGGLDAKSMHLAQRADGGDAGFDGFVAVSRRPGKEQHREGRTWGLAVRVRLGRDMRAMSKPVNGRGSNADRQRMRSLLNAAPMVAATGAQAGSWIFPAVALHWRAPARP